jgi:hypothetical protein
VIVYPNPATDRVYIRTEREVADTRITLTDARGALLISAMMNALPKSGDRTLLDLSGLPAGMYHLSLTTGGTSRTFPVVKQ